ncbi:MAG: hypothetical protein IPN84_09335 [Sphingomonadales bacterium]|nr:hypothetical protein [Sphingomonadales bacterium]
MKHKTSSDRHDRKDRFAQENTQGATQANCAQFVRKVHKMSENEEIATVEEPVGALSGAEAGVEAGGGQLGQTTDGTQTTTATGTTTKP